jgi:GNAT superfamily N-acetyltransferase
MSTNSKLDLIQMKPQDTQAAVKLISTAMNSDESRWAKETFEFYFACKQFGLENGRDYYVYKDGNEIIGLVGLHHYMWGPKENVWLSWFAVSPSCQGKGIGTAMVKAVEQKAREKGFKKFFIETYDGPTFEKARRFYQSIGFEESGSINDYLPGNESMKVFRKNL